jgi:hypothetical protein
MRIDKILKPFTESLHGNDLELIYTIKYSLNGDILHGGFTVKAELNGIEYSVDMFFNIKTKKYNIEQIIVDDGGNQDDGDHIDKELIDSYLANNLFYTVDRILRDD